MTISVTGLRKSYGDHVVLDGIDLTVPSGTVFYSPRQDEPAQELANARNHFFLPRRFRDPFRNEALVLYDKHDLLVLESEDAVRRV